MQHILVYVFFHSAHPILNCHKISKQSVCHHFKGDATWKTGFPLLSQY